MNASHSNHRCMDALDPFFRVAWPKAIALAAGALFLFAGCSAWSQSTSTAQPKALFANLPLNFEQNVGQTSDQAQFVSHGKGYTLFLSSNQAIFEFDVVSYPPDDKTAEKKLGRRYLIERAMKATRKTEVVRMKLLGTNAAVHLSGVDRLPGAVNYFIGNDPHTWRTGIPLFAKVQSSEVFPGIDLVYYGNEKQLEYDLVVKPGADPHVISMGFDGIQSSSIESASGDLAMRTATGGMTLKQPVIYQMVGGQKKLIHGRYATRGENTFGINVGDYDKSQPLIIDPVLMYSTYLGGSSVDGVSGVAVDAGGNAYVTGWTTSTDFPIVGTSITPAPSGTQVTFVSKFNSNGSALIYSTYLGGSGGDWNGGIALDSNGSAYVVGLTGSTNFPVTSNAYQAHLGSGATLNAFVSKLSANGQSLLYSTYLGGGADDEGYGIAVDANQNAYVAGFATSGSPTPFPTTANAFQSTLHSPKGDGFISRIDTTQSGASSLIYSTFLGGSGNGDQAGGIAVDASHNVYVGGMTSSTDFPLTPTAYQSTVNTNGTAFLVQMDLTKFGNAGLIYSTVIPGVWSGIGVALDLNGKVYVTGGEYGPPAYAARFDTTKSGSASLLYFTAVGGSNDTFSYTVSVDTNGDAYLCGWTLSTNLPITSDAIQTSIGSGGRNSYVNVLNPTGSTVLYGTYLGGNGGSNDSALSLALDRNDNIYVGGSTGSSNFQTTSGAFQSSLHGTGDGYLAKLSPLNQPIINSASSTTFFGGSSNSFTVTATGSPTPTLSESGVLPSGVTFNASTGILSGTPALGTEGIYSITFTASNGTSQNATQNFTLAVSQSPYVSSLSPNSGGAGQSVSIQGSGFGYSQLVNTVTFNGTTASILTWSDTAITALVPSGATTGNVVVTVSGVSSSTSQSTVFTVNSTPDVSALVPNIGGAGTSVNIQGSNFGATQVASTVKFNGTLATVTYWDNANIAVNVPAGATTGNVVVTVAGVSSPTGQNSLFTVNTSPNVSSIAPNSGGVGASVYIVGSNYGTTQGMVKFNGTTATAISNWSAFAITAVVPNGATTGDVVVTVGGVSSTTNPNDVFTVNTSPNVVGVVPNIGGFGASVIINGSNFGTTQGGSTVTFNGTTATTISSWSNTVITAIVPSGATTGDVVVTVGGLASATSQSDFFTVNTTPNISGITPNSGSTGTSVTIQGSNYGTAQGTSTVTFNGATATVTTWSNSQIVATVPNGSITGNVVVAVGGVASNAVTFTVVISGSFTATGSMNTSREGHTTTVLNNGLVLVAGGYNGSYLNSAQLYNPATGTFTNTGNMITARGFHTATMLGNGMVLIAGGCCLNNANIASAELYNPATGTFTSTGNLIAARDVHTATLLNNGMVLIAGGAPNIALSELYNPATGTFSASGNLAVAPYNHTATLLNTGKVLIAGGYGVSGYTANSELYDPVSGSFIATGSMTNPRGDHTATLLNNGSVLITGGTGGGSSGSTAELYNPSTGTFTAAGNLTVPRYSHTATLLNNGLVLIAGGCCNGTSVISSAELYNPSTGASTATGSMITARQSQSATPLTNGLVLVAGGYSYGATSFFSSAELYQISGTPLITSLSPTSGVVGTTVTITGKNFGATQGTSTVTFNGAPATPCGSCWSATSITVQVPAGATAGNVVVTIPGVFSTGAYFNVLLPLVFTNSNNTIFAVGVAGSFTVTAPASPAPTYSKTGALPNGVTLAASSGVLSGTPAAGTVGTYPITLTAHNGLNPDGTQNFTLAVQNSAAPSFTSSANAAFTVGAPGSFTVTATGAPTPTLSESGVLPSGITFNTTTGVLAGTPAGGTVGTYPITFTAHNGVGSNATQNFTLTIQALPLSGYSYRRTITIDHTKVANTDQTNFPVLISGTYSFLVTASDGGNVTSPLGYDIAFASDPAGANPLPFEQDGYNPTTGTVNYWVRIPSLSHTTDTVLYIFYGNSAVTTDQSSKNGVWSGTYDGVWHLTDTSDSTSNGNNGAEPGITGWAGKISDAVMFWVYPIGYYEAGVIDVGASATLRPTGAVSTSAWVYAMTADYSSKYPQIISEGDSTGSTGYNLYLNNGYPDFILNVSGWGSCSALATTNVLVDPNGNGTWHYVVGTYAGAGGAVKIYVDGVLQNTVTCANQATNYGTSPAGEIGWKLDHSNNDAFFGNIDEARVSPLALSADWILTEYRNQNSPSTFYSIGGQPLSIPVITSANSATFLLGTATSFTVTATGVPTPTLSESGALPSGVTFSNTTGILSGTPGAGTAKTYAITFMAQNGVNSSTTQNFTLAVGLPATITSAASATFALGSAGSFTVVAIGSPTPTVSELGVLPTGITFSGGLLSGTPAAGTVGVYPIAFIAQNGVGTDVVQDFVLVVIPTAPVITSANAATLVIGAAGSFTVTAIGSPAPTLTESGTLPSGVTFSGGLLGGTPGSTTAGVYPISFTASNGVGSNAVQTFTLTVSAPGTDVYYYFADDLDTARVITNSVGTICYEADFYPFGVERTPYTNTCPQNYKFTGKERDTETGLDNFGARYFTSLYGRFMTPDPLQPTQAHLMVMDQFVADPQNWNEYTYSLDNPVNYRDRGGHFTGDDHERIQIAAMVARGFSPAAIDTAKAANRAMDNGSWAPGVPFFHYFTFHSTQNKVNPQHGERGEHQTREAATAAANDFMATTVASAAERALQGDVRGALEDLGKASHTAQDIVRHNFEKGSEHTWGEAPANATEIKDATKQTNDVLDQFVNDVYNLGLSEGLSMDQINQDLANVMLGSTSQQQMIDPQPLDWSSMSNGCLVGIHCDD